MVYCKTAHIRDDRGNTLRIVIILSDKTKELYTRKRAAHIEQVLTAIRNVNQFLAREKNRERLIQGVCDRLVDTRGYHNAWGVLFDETGNPEASAKAGEKFNELGLLWTGNRKVPCWERALDQPGVVISRNPSSTCDGCPFASSYGGRSGITVRLQHGDKVYGLLGSSLPAELAEDDEEKDLFREVAADIACALYELEIEEAQRKADRKLRLSEERFRAVFDNAADAMFVHEVTGGFLMVNRTACERLEYSRDELLRLAPKDIDSPEYAAHFDANVARLEQCGRYTFETAHVTRSGKRIPIELHSQVIELEGRPVILSIARDVSERKRAEEALLESESRYRKLVDNMNDLIYRVELAPHRCFSYVSPSATAITGYTPGEHYEDPDLGLKLVHPEDRHLLENLARGAKSIKEPVILRWIKKDGSVIWTEQVNAPIYDSQGNLVALEGIARDITERKLAEEEKAKLTEQFHQAQKLESVGRLAGGVAHDLNNLLTPILGYGEMLLEDAAEGADRELLQEIMNAGGRARDLVQQLLAFSRKQVLKFKPIDINILVRGFHNLLRRTIREDVAIHIDAVENLPLVKGDKGQIEQVLMNLAVNAQDAMPDGGGLTIETKQVQLNESCFPPCETVTPGPYVLLAVSDTGCGMDTNTRRRLFEPFFTTKERGKGTGLGLATVYGIVRQHKGHIFVYSEPGRGTTFRIYLPVFEELLPYRESVDTTGTEYRGSEEILLVEDNEQVRELTLALLVQQGYKVIAAGDGREALDILEHHEGVLHLLLTDVIMPEMNGRELFDRVREKFPGIKVLFMSGYTGDVVGRYGMMDPSENFVQKPFSKNMLAGKVREVLEQ
jgi:PAS domain S-box-containing protein